MKTLDALIAAAPVFRGLPSPQLELIAGCGRNERVSAGTVLFREGQPANRFFLIRQGVVALEVHAPGRPPLMIETLDEGDVVGWSWLFPPYRWHLDGRAVRDCALIAFDGACLREKCESDHDLGYALMMRFAADLVAGLQATRMQVLDVYGRG